MTENRLTWATVSGLLILITVGVATAATVMFLLAVADGTGDYATALLLAFMAVVTATLARWSELRHKTDLAERLVAASEEAITTMRRVADALILDGTLDAQAAARAINEANESLARFRAENGLHEDQPLATKGVVYGRGKAPSAPPPPKRS
jgi:hypothetical protein